jgi:hypothetical protein
MMRDEEEEIATLRALIAEKAKDSILKVEFIKANGETRNLLGTLMPDLLPPVVENKTPIKRVENPHTLALWDIENKGWRSFRLDSVQNWE